MSAIVRTRLLGVVFLALVVGAVYLTYAIFSKTFVSYDRITLTTSSVGLQLPERADVKVRGVIVGEVLNMDADADGAKLTLGIYPDKLDTIPANVTGSIVPKTLFGEKYVSLVIPDTGVSPGHIEAGATIDRTVVSTEVEEVLSDLYPFLSTVQPIELNQTLTALATALEGRGEELGQDLVTLDNYLKKLNPQLPQFLDDIERTGTVAQTYASVFPQVADILRNSVTTGNTLEGREAKLQALFQNISSFADTADSFLRDNGDNMIRLGQVSAPQIRLLSKYSTEFPCLTAGLVNAGKLEAEAFRDFKLHIILEVLPNQPRAYNANDKPVNGEDRGPSCNNLPNPPWSQENPFRHVPNFDDGVDEPTGKGTDRAAPGYEFRAGIAGPGSPAEAALLRALIAPSLGIASADVPDLAVLLIGPAARGAKEWTR